MRDVDLMKFKNWVVVGDVTNPTKYAYRILSKFYSAGFNVSGVNPRATKEGTYKSLEQVAYKIDAIDLCINPRDGIDIVRQAKELEIKYILIQPGAESEEIFNFCRNNNIIAVEGCALVALNNLVLTYF
ncbi:CoA-binding protein [Clostridium polyendosporum]|uniref:CoA-binding protein n=1 Tax=Clostridium polyendosporum TaxID=69208 RepID=A0A919RZ67_9CLOT|nr:CoA-binding protein [Clostridium polyendosporum]GIM28942.1 CoA-binding protein [Clostridium polyendosporum]